MWDVGRERRADSEMTAAACLALVLLAAWGHIGLQPPCSKADRLI